MIPQTLSSPCRTTHNPYEEPLNVALHFFMIYDETKWKSKRVSILRRDGYQDQVLKRYGKLVQAEIVHHIFPVEEYPEFAYEDWNLTSVSVSTHNKLHDRITNELTEAGIELLRRTARKNNIEVPDKYKHPIKKRGSHGRVAPWTARPKGMV